MPAKSRAEHERWPQEVLSQASGTAKSDPLMAALNAAARMSANPTRRNPASL
jgi:phage terminase large subunit-like protein